MDIVYDLSKDLPEELNITDRSRKFWEGKYTFDHAGFTDHDGVYRTFDCYAEQAGAPTPLPPIYLMKCTGEDQEQGIPAEAATAEAPVRSQSASFTSAPARDQVRTSDNDSSKDDKSNSVSPLSDCPSDLSDWEVSDKTKKSTTKVKDEKVETMAEEPEAPKTKTQETPKRNTTTRDVAQKVSKSAKAKKEKAPAAAPVVLQRQTGRGTARRRSGR